ncbi:heme-containing dehydratase protein [Cercophora samala]|uniref:Heme-containing dehydratase protein n=1 Tax=Cercophora samala TaxID=330535 RepID=A0AA39YYD1_9PEZI|nr:heme-containing dehydratase protein [Cercophora samala]
MRDQLPASQTDALVGGKPATEQAPNKVQPPGASQRRLKVAGKKNLAVIRSGQDWLDTSPEERELYLETMHPVLIQGMEFLRDHGGEVGCYRCRFMDIIDPTTRAADKDRTFGLAYFDNLASLGRWCKEHSTHLAIFGGFHQYPKKLGHNVTLRVFH